MRLDVNSEDEFEIFHTHDGDTVWNAKSEQEPQYVHKLLEKLQADAKEMQAESVELSSEAEDHPPIKDSEMFAEPSVRLPAAWPNL